MQTIAALVIVAVTVGLLVRSLLKKNKTPGCAGGCGCPSDDLKKRVRSMTSRSS